VTRRWRERDSNPRSPCCGGARCSWRRATRVRDIDRVDRTRNKHAMPVSLKDILEAFEFVSADNAGEHRAFLCRQSGRVYWYVEYSNDELWASANSNPFPAVM